MTWRLARSLEVLRDQINLAYPRRSKARDGTLGEQQTLVGGFQDDDGSRWGRPVAAVTGPGGAVYISDDYAGAVYRLAPPGR